MPVNHIPLVVHVVYRLDTGGMENGLINILNRMPPQRYRHVIVCLTEVGDFAGRFTRDDIEIISLGEAPGHSFLRYFRLWRVLWRYHPAIVHTRNLPTLEAQLPAALIPGVRRVHGEHGRDVFDLEGTRRKYLLLRRVLDPLIHCYIAVSRDLQAWLQKRVAAVPDKVQQIYNGVSTEDFHPGPSLGSKGLAPIGFLASGCIVLGTVGRLVEVKDHRTLLTAFAATVRTQSSGGADLRLIVVGSGPLLSELQDQAAALGIAERVWFTGDRSDVPALLRLFDVFALPSLGEGISNTLLEAMATGIPVIATRVGGNVELVRDGINGTLVPRCDVDELGAAISAYANDAALRQSHGAAGRVFVFEHFDWDHCVAQYMTAYDELLRRS